MTHYEQETTMNETAAPIQEPRIERTPRSSNVLVWLPDSERTIPIRATVKVDSTVDYLNADPGVSWPELGKLSPADARQFANALNRAVEESQREGLTVQ